IYIFHNFKENLISTFSTYILWWCVSFTLYTGRIILIIVFHHTLDLNIMYPAIPKIINIGYVSWHIFRKQNGMIQFLEETIIPVIKCLWMTNKISNRFVSFFVICKVVRVQCSVRFLVTKNIKLMKMRILPTKSSLNNMMEFAEGDVHRND